MSVAHMHENVRCVMWHCGCWQQSRMHAPVHAPARRHACKH